MTLHTTCSQCLADTFRDEGLSFEDTGKVFNLDLLSIFELGFAGKGRIYYGRAARSGYRVLAIGAKNSQQKDLEYLSRLSSSE